MRAEHQCSEIEAMQRAVLATVQSRHNKDTSKLDWDALESKIQVRLPDMSEAEGHRQELVLAEAADATETKMSTQKLIEEASRYDASE